MPARCRCCWLILVLANHALDLVLADLLTKHSCRTLSLARILWPWEKGSVASCRGWEMVGCQARRLCSQVRDHRS